MLIVMTVIPYGANSTHENINVVVKQIAAEEKLPLFDIAPRYLAELSKGPDDPELSSLLAGEDSRAVACLGHAVCAAR